MSEKAELAAKLERLKREKLEASEAWLEYPGLPGHARDCRCKQTFEYEGRTVVLDGCDAIRRTWDRAVQRWELKQPGGMPRDQVLELAWRHKRDAEGAQEGAVAVDQVHGEPGAEAPGAGGAAGDVDDAGDRGRPEGAGSGDEGDWDE
jgi:hypothetical protein